MRMHFTAGTLAGIALLGLSLATGSLAAPAGPPKTVVLVGASIGAGWKIDRLPDRTGVTGYDFRYVGVYDFDKTAAIDAIVRGPSKPEVVMIKECSTYFPGNLADYERKMQGWVRMLREAGIAPVLVTTPPLDVPEGTMQRGKEEIKHLLGRGTASEGIAKFNDWMKAYAAREHIPVFDLEAVLRRAPDNRWMKAEYDSGDRVHLNATGYQAMDRAFTQFLSGEPALRAER
ncbi:MAG TPA: SGNH/GDSL hydrolase family protein [Usitatibacter sp.]|jgi:hypothetical protein|nr:SGNH/GDSL hydrolase family protein [Usitatibacter sp.]